MSTKHARPDPPRPAVSIDLGGQSLSDLTRRRTAHIDLASLDQLIALCDVHGRHIDAHLSAGHTITGQDAATMNGHQAQLVEQARQLRAAVLLLLQSPRTQAATTTPTPERDRLNLLPTVGDRVLAFIGRTRFPTQADVMGVWVTRGRTRRALVRLRDATGREWTDTVPTADLTEPPYPPAPPSPVDPGTVGPDG